MTEPIHDDSYNSLIHALEHLTPVCKEYMRIHWRHVVLSRIKETDVNYYECDLCGKLMTFDVYVTHCNLAEGCDGERHEVCDVCSTHCAKCDVWYTDAGAYKHEDCRSEESEESESESESEESELIFDKSVGCFRFRSELSHAEIERLEELLQTQTDYCCERHKTDVAAWDRHKTEIAESIKITPFF